MTTEDRHLDAFDRPEVPNDSAFTRRRPTRPARRLRLAAMTLVAVFGVVGLSIGLAPSARVGADILVDPSVPTDPPTLPPTDPPTLPPTDPPTVPPTVPPTSPPTTAPPPTTTTAPPTTTTTRPPVLTSRPTPSTSRPSTATTLPRSTPTTGGGTTTSGGGSSTNPDVFVSSRTGKVLAAAAKQAFFFGDGAALPDVTPSTTGLAAVDVLPRVVTRPTTRRNVPRESSALGFATGEANALDPLNIAAWLAAAIGAVLLAFGVRAVVRSRRRATSDAPLFVDRHAVEIEVHAALIALVAAGPIKVEGDDCRALQLLVKVAAIEGLEIHDPHGFVARASDRLVQAFGLDPDRKRLPLHWTVTVGHRSMVIPDGARYLMQETGPDGVGRDLAFAPDTPLDLWEGDCL